MIKPFSEKNSFKVVHPIAVTENKFANFQPGNLRKCARLIFFHYNRAPPAVFEGVKLFVNRKNIAQPLSLINALKGKLVGIFCQNKTGQKQATDFLYPDELPQGKKSATSVQFSISP